MINFTKYHLSTYKSEAEELYNSSFPDDEKVPFNILINRLADGKMEFYVVSDDNNFVGIDVNIAYKDMLYIFYLAVAKDKRNKGFGSLILQTIRSNNPNKRITLTIEEVDPKYENYDERVKRLAFYQKNGFKEAGYNHYEYGVMYSMLSMNDYVKREEHIELMCSIFGNRYHKVIKEK